MTKALLTMKETAEMLFGENDDNARRRAIHLLQSQKIATITTGQKRLVRRDVLDKHFGIDGQRSKSPSDLDSYQR
jgi:hypothetical protein